jgi:hypothetical protein
VKYVEPQTKRATFSTPFVFSSVDAFVLLFLSYLVSYGGLSEFRKEAAHNSLACILIKKC